METFTYFAYGSNMLIERLVARCPRAEFICSARAPNYRLLFSKRSKDGSGKATIARISDLNMSVQGALFRVPVSERSNLDEAEGPDYDRDDNFLVVRNDDEQMIRVSVYIAKPNAVNHALRPYDWYRELILEGANQHGLPVNYVKGIAGLTSDPDPVPTRKTRQQAIALLNKRWEAGLNGCDRTVLLVARRLYSTFPAEGACYRTAFFLFYHLKARFGVEGIARVGFVNDGTDDLFSSHAWYELDGRITDLAISRPLNSTVQRRGPLTILGREMQPGWPWTYQIERSAEGLRTISQLLEAPESREAISMAESLHHAMVATSKRDEQIRAYLDHAPDGLTYEVLANRIDQVPDDR